MKHSLHFVLCFLIVIGTSDIFARRGGGSSFRSSSPSRSSSFRSSPSRSSRSSSFKSKKSTPAKKSTRATKSSTLKKTSTSKKAKPKAVARSKVAKKKQKALAQKNNAAAKKYGNKKNAEKAFREKMSSQNKYTSSTPPSKRPDYVPQNVTINNTHVSTSYGMLPGGGYGYGYMDPTTHMFCALAAHQMIVNDAMLMNHGYGSYGPGGQPVMMSTGASIAMIIIWIIVACVVIALIIVAIRAVI